jgi:hypothetical protein
MNDIWKDDINKLLWAHTERLKEIHSINETVAILEQGKALDESLQEICSLIPEAWQFPEFTTARITYDKNIFYSKNFKETPWKMSRSFKIPGNKTGSIDVYYLKEFPQFDEGPFLKEERNLIDNLANLISGSANKEALQKLLYDNTERLKELKGINSISQILKQGIPLEEAMQYICDIMPESWQYPEYTVARLTYDGRIFLSKKFKETRWVQKQPFEMPDGKQGLIEIFYLKDFPESDEGPFMKEERNLINNLAEIISGSAAKNLLKTLLWENRERLKELSGINQTTHIISLGLPIDETLQRICSILPAAWQYPEDTACRIKYEGKEFVSRKFTETIWRQSDSFTTINNKKGVVEVFYLKEYPHIYEGPFLKEERNLIYNIAQLIAAFINHFKGREVLSKDAIPPVSIRKSDEYRESLIKNQKPLQAFFNQQTLDKYIYLDMMRFKVKDILFVATLYDAFVLENEDAFFEQFMGEIYQYSLFSLPRITGVSSPEQALDIIETTRFDFVILMVGNDIEGPLELSKKIKKKKPDLNVFVLLNNKEKIKYFEDLVFTSDSIDRLFIWNGDSQIFFALVKSMEDRVNVENDTKVGLVRVILLIEDSAYYYSKYISMLYEIVFSHIQQIIAPERNELDKISKMRSRPKILLATNYEEASYLFNKYKEFILCVISDVEFEKNGVLNKNAGINFISYAKKQIKNLPTILQSSDDRNAEKARKLDSSFINKNSDHLLAELKRSIKQYIGYGDFVFRDPKNRRIAVAHNLREFEILLNSVPDESLLYHAQKNQFSFWLMGRGEIHIAKILNPIKVTKDDSGTKIRSLLIDTINKTRDDKKRGKVLPFEESYDFNEKTITSLANGSLGGKGRGLAFIHTLIYNLELSDLRKEINIRAPITAIIGTDEYESFITRNKLSRLGDEPDFEKIKQLFIHGKLSRDLIRKLKVFCDQIKKPLAVRSSSLFEDSITNPFAGIFNTYIIPNNHHSDKTRLESLMTAIKLVYASIFSNQARSYFKAIHHKMEEERMAVVLQELVGNQYGDFYYPNISGIAQSYNFYPIAHMNPDEGYAVLALGLGTYVVEGGKSYRFSPLYPNVDAVSPKDQLKGSQVELLALNLSKKDANYFKYGEKAALSKLTISEAEKHGNLKHCASVYNFDNDMIVPGISQIGPRIINFANILKFDYIPLARTINLMLDTIKEAMGSPVEIEFAVDLNKDAEGKSTFYLLQVKPLVGNQLSYNIDLDEIDKSEMLLYSETSLGNGKNESLRDVVFADIEKFNKLKTAEMALEIELLNSSLEKNNLQYILIGPGRWGTRDKSVGIPVDWSQISNAKVIVEVGLADYPLDASLGSHFFHNIASMNIGYFSIQSPLKKEFIKWDTLKKQKLINSTSYFKHVRFENPVTVMMDGKQRKSLILLNNE